MIHRKITHEGVIQTVVTRSGVVASIEGPDGRWQGHLPLTWEDAEVLCSMLAEALAGRQDGSRRES